MNIVIIKTTNNFDSNKRIFGALEKLGHNLLGFVALYEINGITKIDGYNFYPVDYIHRLKFDLALLDQHSGIIGAVFPSLVHNKFPMHKVRTYMWLLQQIMIRKYEESADPVIQETLKYWRNHELSVFNQHFEGVPQTMDEVYVDEKCNLPYINFKTVSGNTRRMYYPKNHNFVTADNGKRYIANVLIEQAPTSPHLYIKGTHKVDEGDVLIDAGVCEGNFSLRYVDICSKVYLFEPDKQWFEPLYYSFKDCWDKVEFIPIAVSDSTRGGQ